MATNTGLRPYVGHQTAPVDLTGPQGPAGAVQNAIYAADFGVEADGSHDDTAGLIAALEHADNVDNKLTAVVLPPGIVKVTDTINWPTNAGSCIKGGGKAYLQYNDAQRGTQILAVGLNGKPVFNLDGTSFGRMSDLTIVGSDDEDPSTWADFAIRLQNRGTAGAGELIFENLRLYRSLVGFNAGHVDVGDTDHNGNNAADCTFRRIDVLNSLVAADGIIGFQFLGLQQVNYGIYDCSAGDKMIAFDTPGGSALTVVNFATFNTALIHRSGYGGSNTGFNTFMGLKLDGGEIRTILYQATQPGFPTKSHFINPHFGVGQLAISHTTGGARVQLKAGHFVRIDGGENLCNANGQVVEFDGGGTFLGIGMRVDPSNVKGSGTETGFRTRDCIDEGDGTFTADV